ncbi:hypothetical protein L873DRAFT_704982 [Choiromyces venosus 120613-1]|uniref:Uncharacterized protein n=1 Tax=Choiromyces venosus 120613-1 TaxID=1336337 RepID=A0A3N4IY04_9PEZI|nr:hypothetical protein L873DRAFT_704982 [Choiromyces venosus 120613-1]
MYHTRYVDEICNNHQLQSLDAVYRCHRGTATNTWGVTRTVWKWVSTTLWENRRSHSTPPSKDGDRTTLKLKFRFLSKQAVKAVPRRRHLLSSGTGVHGFTF